MRHPVRVIPEPLTPVGFAGLLWFYNRGIGPIRAAAMTPRPVLQSD